MATAGTDGCRFTYVTFANRRLGGTKAGGFSARDLFTTTHGLAGSSIDAAALLNGGGVGEVEGVDGGVAGDDAPGVGGDVTGVWAASPVGVGDGVDGRGDECCGRRPAFGVQALADVHAPSAMATTTAPPMSRARRTPQRRA
ncbi:hypothetical protein GCM10009617_33100 [Leifsonia poae]|uniref:Uncharacterized protein n=1 Tax=Leifsonia poae TaxID=110933 RepID=A0A9W6H9A9_9MICO|nr:hypothetical protein GCM10017584_16760 [Leifsonia poae]